MEQQIKDQLRHLIMAYAEASYNDMYSSACYERKKSAYAYMIATVLMTAKICNIDVSDVKAEYCGWEYTVEDFSSYEELVEYW